MFYRTNGRFMYYNFSSWPSSARIYHRLNLCIFAALAFVLSILLLAHASEAKDDDGRLSLGPMSLPSLCVNSMIAGKPCPGCGTTRSVALWLQGKYTASHARHPSGPWVGRWLIAQALLRLFLLILGPYAARIRVVDAVLSLSTFLLAAYLPMALT